MTKKILMRKGNQKLIGVVITEGSKQRIAVMLYQESKNGEISVPTIIQRSELLKKSKALQDLLNLSICLTEEELDEVVEKAKVLLETADQTEDVENMDDRSTPSQLYRAICERGKEVVSNLIIEKEAEEPKWMIWLDRDYLCIRTSDFADFIKGVTEADEYRKTDILRSLKLLGVLDTDSGRAYDKKISTDGQKINCYRIQMPATKAKKAKVEKAQAVEEIIAETDAKAEYILQETNQPKPSSSEKEKLQKAMQEIIADENKIEIVPTVSKNEETVDIENVDDWYKQIK